MGGKLIFITGAEGFVGKHLQKILFKKKIPFVAGSRSIYGDISIQNDWARLLIGCDVVVHLAARVHVMNETDENPINLFRKYNVEATANLAKSAKSIGIKKFIFISSIKVNGEETFEIPFKPSDIPNPKDAYGLSKAEAEQELLKLHEPGVFEVVIIRPPLIYGPGVKANFQGLMKVVKRNLPLPFGLICNKRSLVSVLNLSDLIVTCLIHPEAGGKIFLVSDDCDFSLKELILRIAKVQNKVPILIPVPIKLMNLIAQIIGKKSYANRLFGNLQVDISETKRILNWKPPYSFEETFYNQ